MAGSREDATAAAPRSRRRPGTGRPSPNAPAPMPGGGAAVPTTRRALLRAAPLLAPLPALAQSPPGDFPNRPVRLVIAYSAGGVADTVARILQPKVAEHLGQPVVVENRTGASGAVGAAAVAQSPPDGYTVLLEGATAITSPLVNRGLPVDYAGFVPVTQVAAQPYVLGVRAGFPAEDLRGFLAEARRRPGEVTFGTPGIAHVGHLMGELLQSLAGVRMEHVPYRGGADVARDLAGGRIDSAFISESSLKPVFESARGRPFAVTGRDRRPNLPGVPAMGEVVPGYELATWMVIFAPAGTPRPVVERLASAFRHATADPDTRRRVEGIGNDPMVTGPEEAAALVARDREVLTRLIRGAGLLGGGGGG